MQCIEKVSQKETSRIPLVLPSLKLHMFYSSTEFYATTVPREELPPGAPYGVLHQGQEPEGHPGQGDPSPSSPERGE